MVFFTCNNCGTTIKKNQVSTHLFKCRNASVSCMDCGKDFWGTEYEAHIKCVSEAEKYSGKNFVPKANSNKGQKRQDEWLDCLNELLKTGNLRNNIRGVIEMLVNKPNVPQKKAKFENFLRNVNIRSPPVIAEVWGIISKALEELKATKSALTKPSGDVSAVKLNDVENNQRSDEPLIETGVMKNEIETETAKEKSKKRKRQKKGTSEEELENGKNVENIDIKSNEADGEAENKIKKKKKNSKNKEDSKSEIVENESKPEVKTAKELSKKRKRQKKTSEEEVENCQNLENIEIKGNEVDNKTEKCIKKNSQNNDESKSEIVENEAKPEVKIAKEKSKKRKRQKKSTPKEELENCQNLENIEIKGNEVDNGTELSIKKKKKNNGSNSEEILSPANKKIKQGVEADSVTNGKENGKKKRTKNLQKKEDSKSEEIESPNKKIKQGQTKFNKVK